MTGTLASSKGLSFLISGNKEHEADAEMPKAANGTEISATMARHLGVPHRAGLGSVETGSTRTGSIRSGISRNGTRSNKNRAAGAYDPNLDPMDGMQISQEKSGGKKSGFMKMFGKGNTTSLEKKQSLGVGQKLEGAEFQDLKSRQASTLEDQMEYFTQQSGKLLILRRQKREVIFATSELISFFGLPINTSKQMLSSPLLHSDFLGLLCGGDKRETKSLRSTIQTAISKGEAISIEVGIRQPSKNRFASMTNSSDGIIKSTTMHLTPLKDRENFSYALVALFA